jgi:hypothetical protein
MAGASVEEDGVSSIVPVTIPANASTAIMPIIHGRVFKIDGLICTLPLSGL